jgi:hypothetical protein
MRNLLGRLASWLGRRPQSAPLDASPFAGMTSEEIKAELAALIRAAYDEGVQAERKRIGEILQAPGASTFLEIAVELALGNASGTQAAGVLARAEADAATRAAAIKSNLLESANVATLH